MDIDGYRWIQMWNPSFADCLCFLRRHYRPRRRGRINDTPIWHVRRMISRCMGEISSSTLALLLLLSCGRSGGRSGGRSKDNTSLAALCMDARECESPLSGGLTSVRCALLDEPPPARGGGGGACAVKGADGTDFEFVSARACVDDDCRHRRRQPAAKHVNYATGRKRWWSTQGHTE